MAYFNNEIYIVWNTDHAGGSHANHLDHLIDSKSHVIHIVGTLSPTPMRTDAFTKNPVTELCILNFDSSLSQEKTNEVNGALINFRSTLLEKLPDNLKPLSWSMGHIERPAFRDHFKSSSGKSFVTIIAVGWESKDLHMQVKDTQTFTDGITPIRQRMLPPLATDMRHVSFKKI